jgi:transposase
VDLALVDPKRKQAIICDVFEFFRVDYLPPYSPQLNPIEQLWKFMKYYWIEFDAYKSAKHMRDYVEKVLIGYGTDYEINFV